MLQSLLRKNFKMQLIVPVAFALLLMIVSVVGFTVYTQKNSSKALNEQVQKSFSEIEKSIGEDLGLLSGRIEKDLLQMQHGVSGLLEKESSKALQETADNVKKDIQSIREQSANDMIQLMAISATNSVITKDYATLNSYARSAHQNEDIVFLFYIDKEGKPLTRYLNRKNEKLKSYLSKGKPDIEKIIVAGKQDSNVLVLRHDISSEGDVVGSITLAMDMGRARQQAELMSEQFDRLVTENSTRIDSVLGKESNGINSALQGVVQHIQEGIAKRSSDTVGEITTMGDTLSNRTRNFLTIGLTIGFFLVLGILLLNAGTILKMLGGEPSAMMELARQIADGNLSNNNDSSNASVPGSLLATLQDMSRKLRSTIGSIVEEGRVLQSTSTELALAAENMIGGAEKSASRANTVAAATEEMSTNMSMVTAASEQAAGNVNVVAIAMEEMASAVEEIAQNTGKASSMTEDAVNYARNSSEKVNLLGDAAREISKVTEVITEISEQTNLLALNATIEAARAGDAGKGFAVVANEIKELAKQTAEATGEIKAKIESIQNSTEDTVKEITEISSVINSVNELVSTIAAASEEQSVTTKDISDNVHEAANGITEVNENVAQASAVASEIARDIADVSNVSNEAKEGSLTLQEYSLEIKGVTQKISHETDQFDLGRIESSKVGLRTGSRAKSLLRWSESLSVGIESIDSQHKELIDLINDLHNEMKTGSSRDSAGKALKKLIDYTERHFKYEENIFAKHDYSELDSHKDVHSKLVGQIIDFQEQFEKGQKDISLDLMEFLKDWIVNHIKKTDMQYSAFLVSKGVV